MIYSLLCRSGKRYSTTLNLSGGLDHGITLELGAFVAKIQPGSVAAKEGSIAVGDRIICVSEATAFFVTSTHSSLWAFRIIMYYFIFLCYRSMSKVWITWQLSAMQASS